MSRSLTAGMITEVTAPQLRPIILVKAEFDGGDILFWSGIGSLLYSGDTYVGAGNLLDISRVEETTEIEAKGVSVVLSGANSAIVSLALLEDYQGRPITITFATLDSAGAIIADPITLFKGIMDVIQIDDNADTSTIVVQAENRLINLQRQNVRRYTPEDQKQEFSGDLGCDFVAGLQEKEITWGGGS